MVMIVIVCGDGEGTASRGGGRGGAGAGDGGVGCRGVAGGCERTGVQAGGGVAFGCEGGFSDFGLFTLNVDIAGMSMSSP